MARNRSRRDSNLRRHIAYLAARMMAVDGVADYASAKQKAARQAGLADAHLLPDNAEVEAALREFQDLFQREEQAGELRRLREVAVRAMRELAEFRPVLVGSVLNGTAGRHSDVNLQVFTDDPKALTVFFLNRRCRFEQGARSVRRAGRMEEVPQLSLDLEGVTVTLTVLPALDERSSPRPTPDGPPPRARLDQVEALLLATAPS